MVTKGGYLNSRDTFYVLSMANNEQRKISREFEKNAREWCAYNIEQSARCACKHGRVFQNI